MNNQKIVISCDVESLCFPQTRETIQANIFGKTSHFTKVDSGIPLIINLADQAGAKVVFFYDVFTEYSCPGINL